MDIEQLNVSEHFGAVELMLLALAPILMTEQLTRIQKWYKTNCNGDWEHSWGFEITTLDNPAWTVKIDLQDTSLDNLKFNKEFQNPEIEHDWYFIKVEGKSLIITRGPENLIRSLRFFSTTF